MNTDLGHGGGIADRTTSPIAPLATGPAAGQRALPLLRVDNRVLYSDWLRAAIPVALGFLEYIGLLYIDLAIVLY